MADNEMKQELPALVEPFVYVEESEGEAVAAIDAWDSGAPIPTVEMGGLGPGYEQAIQIAIVEIARAVVHARPQTVEGFHQIADEAIHKINDGVGGFSGAQVGAAKGVALRMALLGWRRVVDSFPDDRQILASKFWPKAP